MPEPGTVEVPAGLLRDYQAALDGLKGLPNGDGGYEPARDKAAKAEEKLLSHLTANPGPTLDLGTAGQVLKDIRDMPRPEPPNPARWYIYDDPVLDGPSSVRQPSQPAPPPPPPAPPPQAAPKPAARGERPKLPGSMAPYVGTNWDLFLDNDPDIPHQAVEQFRALIRENWGDFSPSEQGWLNGHGFYDEPKPLPPPSQPPNKTSLPDSPSSSNAISLPSVASAAGPLLILVGICLATFTGCALTTEDLGVAQIETASNANSSGAPAKAAVAIPAEPRFSIANGTVADVPTAPHIQSGSCSQSGISTQCNLQLSSDPASWASQTHGTVGITMSFDNNAVSISWQDAGGVAKPITSKGSATSGATAAMGVQGAIVLVSLDGPKPTTWGAAIVIQRTPADAIHRATLGATASQGGTLPVTDLTRGGGKAVAPATGATAGAPVAAAGGNLNGGCNVIATAGGTHGDTGGGMSAPSAADPAA